MTARQPHPQEYIFACDCCENKCKVISHNAIPPDCGCLINSDVGAIWSSRPHSSAPALEPNPCEENGCTDTDQCDEICQHQRIYTPAQMGEKIKAERGRVLDSVVIRCHFLIPPDILDEPHHRIERATLEKVFKEIKSLRGGEQE